MEMNNIRAKKLLEHIKNEKSCSIDGLLEKFKVSKATIHRDLTELASNNLIRKNHGSVEYLDIPIWPKGENSNFEVRIKKNSIQKQEIAQKAVKLAKDNSIIFIDSSSTSLYFARALREKIFSNLTIITNSLPLVQEFPLFPSCFNLISIGGIYNSKLNSFLGRISNIAIKGLKIDMGFISAAGLSMNGIYTFHENHAEFLEYIINNADTTNLLIDSSKIDKEAVFRICNPGKAFNIVTDSNIEKENLEKYSDAGFNII
jgi:DeoR/GlpR family transcriptional regulator of sugar metabolism